MWGGMRQKCFGCGRRLQVWAVIASILWCKNCRDEIPTPQELGL
jgi:hypothetical protein